MTVTMYPKSSRILLAGRNVTVGYADFSLSGITFEIRTNDFVYITGPNGGGKTTLLKSIGGILPLLHGQWQRTSGLSVGYVPQQTAMDTVFPLSASEIIQHGRLGRTTSTTEQDRFMRLISEFNLTSVLQSPYRQLSGGQRQRVLIVRALIGNPGLLLLDEPTSGLDAASTAALMVVLRSIVRKENVGIVMVTHQTEGIVHHLSREINVDFNTGVFCTAGPSQCDASNERAVQHEKSEVRNGIL